MEPSDALHSFRHSLYGCLHRRGDALFELTDAILTADTLPSSVHLSLQASHRRGWGSLYAALDRGRIETLKLYGDCSPAIRSLEAEQQQRPSTPWTRACGPAVTRSVAPYSRLLLPPVKALGWRQPIVAGWAYQFIAQIGFVRESWTAPLDVARPPIPAGRVVVTGRR